MCLCYNESSTASVESFCETKNVDWLGNKRIFLLLIYFIIKKWVKLTWYRLVSVLFELMHMICGLQLFLAVVLVTLLLAYLDHLHLNYHQALPLGLIPFYGTCVSHLQSSCKYNKIKTHILLQVLIPFSTPNENNFFIASNQLGKLNYQKKNTVLCIATVKFMNFLLDQSNVSNNNYYIWFHFVVSAILRKYL